MWQQKAESLERERPRILEGADFKIRYFLAYILTADDKDHGRVRDSVGRDDGASRLGKDVRDVTQTQGMPTLSSRVSDGDEWDNFRLRRLSEADT